MDSNLPGALYALVFPLPHLCLGATKRITREHEAGVVYSTAFFQVFIVISLAIRLLSGRGVR